MKILLQIITSQKLIFFSLVKVVRLGIIVSKRNIINNNNKNISYHNKEINPKSGHNIEKFWQK